MKNRPSRDEHTDDIMRLSRVAAMHGHVLPADVAYEVWSEYSDTFAAGWLYLDGHDDDQLWFVIQRYTEES
jgi:hypothetical protein